jgi:hypothetical protein
MLLNRLSHGQHSQVDVHRFQWRLNLDGEEGVGVCNFRESGEVIAVVRESGARSSVRGQVRPGENSARRSVYQLTFRERHPQLLAEGDGQRIANELDISVLRPASMSNIWEDGCLFANGGECARRQRVCWLNTRDKGGQMMLVTAFSRWPDGF